MIRISDVANLHFLQMCHAENRFATGLLLAPEDVAFAKLGGILSPDVHTDWYISGQVHPEMDAALQRGCKVLHLGRIYATESGMPYVVLCQQAGHWQHRFVLQMASAEMRGLLYRAQVASMRYLLGTESSLCRRVICAPAYMAQAMPPDLPVAAGATDIGEMCAEACSVALAMMQPDAVTDDAYPPVRDVCVTIVQSQDLLEQMKAWLSHRRMRKSR